MGRLGETLLGRAQAGDEAAFACIFRDVQPALLRYLRVIAPEAEDVAGETWLQVVAGPGRVPRRRARRSGRGCSPSPGTGRSTPAGRGTAVPPCRSTLSGAEEQLTSADTADLALEAVSARAVVALVRSLPPEQAEVIMLRVVAGLDSGDVARIVGKSPGAVRVAAHRGLRRLAEMVERAGCNTMSGPDAMHGEMPGFFPGRPGGERTSRCWT